MKSKNQVVIALPTWNVSWWPTLLYSTSKKSIFPWPNYSSTHFILSDDNLIRREKVALEKVRPNCIHWVGRCSAFVSFIQVQVKSPPLLTSETSRQVSMHTLFFLVVVRCTLSKSHCHKQRREKFTKLILNLLYICQFIHKYFNFINRVINLYAKF